MKSRKLVRRYLSVLIVVFMISSLIPSNLLANEETDIDDSSTSIEEEAINNDINDSIEIDNLSHIDNNTLGQRNLLDNEGDLTREVEYKASGTFGEGFTWTLTEDGVLTISGTGAMEDFSGVAARPWQTYKDEIVKVIIEEGITRVGSRTCTNIPNLAEVELAESVKELAANSFNTTPALKSINLENVTSIGTMAFQRSGLTEVRLKDCAVADTAFRQCESLTAATFEGEVTIGNSAFLGTALESLDLSNVKNCGTAFVGLSTLKSVTIGSKLTELNLSGTGITELTVPANLQTYLFSLNTSLETVTIEDGVTVIPDSAFGGNTALKTVSIPATVTSIAENAFNTCDALTTINFGGTRAQWEAIGYTAAEGVDVICTDDLKISIQEASVIFEGMIRIKYYFGIPEELKSSDDVWLVFSKEGVEVARVPLSEGIASGNQTVFYYNVVPKAFSDIVTVKVLANNGSTIWMVGSAGTNYTESGFDFSPKMYADFMAENGSTEQMRTLAEAFLDYGAATSIYFGGSGEISDAINSVDSSNLDNFNIETSGTKPVGLFETEISVMFEADNAIRIYYKCQEGYSPADYFYGLDDETNPTLHQRSDGMYYLTALNIAAKDLDESHVFSITGNGVTYSISASVMAYAKLLVSSSKEESQNLGKALYLYNEAAEACFGD